MKKSGLIGFENLICSDSFSYRDMMQKHGCSKNWPRTVDGRNSAPVDMVNFPLVAGFHTCRVVGRISINSIIACDMTC